MKSLPVLIALLFICTVFAGCFDESEEKSLDEVKDFFDLSSTRRSFLDGHHFVAIKHGTYTNFPKAYEMLHDEHIPIFVTTDSVLHLYHQNFDDTLKDIEEHFLYFSAVNLTYSMLNASEQDYPNLSGDLKELAKLNVAFFSVAASLLDPEFEAPDYVNEIVEKEMRKIENHSGFHECVIMPPPHIEDYSQYVPRGHYTESELLKKYFKGMMWYGRMAFYLKDENETRMAVMNALNLNEHAAGDWEALYNITAFYVGTADDLTYQDYLRGITEVYGSLSADYHELENSTKLQEFRELVKTYRKPKIFSTFIWDYMNETEETMGFRIMGQRFIPDSYMFQQLVYDKVLDYQGSGEPFTLVKTPFRDIRGFPRGLDVFSALGSERAHEILEREGDTEYKNYTEQCTKLKDEFENYNASVWEQNLYWRWLDGLRMLTGDFKQADYPKFMRDSAWKSEKLNTNLGSWTELRHDTILYAKQSYTSYCSSGGSGSEPKYEERGYVEPVPEFYSHLLNLTLTTKEGLEKRGYLTREMERNLSTMEYLLDRLKGISEKELQGKSLSDSEYRFIREIYEYMGSYKDKVPLVADVHTDTNSGEVLEEATGYLDFVLVKVKIKGDTTICAGPIFSHYEFKHPMDDRLTDEKWREMLAGGKVPARAPWVKDYMPDD